MLLVLLAEIGRPQSRLTRFRFTGWKLAVLSCGEMNPNIILNHHHTNMLL